MLQLTEHDKKAKCLCGLPLRLNDVLIYPITVRDVIEVGEQQYGYYLNFIVNFKSLFEALAKDKVEEEQMTQVKEANDYDFVIVMLSFNEEVAKLFCQAMSFFLKRDDISFESGSGYFKINPKIDDEGNEIEQLFIKEQSHFDEFIDIIKMQNYLLKKDDVDEKPANKKAREILEKKKKAKAKVDKLKSRKNQQLAFADYISVVNCKSLNVSTDKCLNMTVYGFFDYLERLTLIDSYDVGVKQLLAGAKPDQVKLQHWLSKL